MGQPDNWHMIDPYAITWMYNLWVRQNAMYEHEELYTDHGESDEEYVTDVLVDICARYIVLFSNEGNEKKVQANDTLEFMELLGMVRDICDEDIIYYSDPVVAD